jgi:hypothetical protein
LENSKEVYIINRTAYFVKPSGILPSFYSAGLPPLAGQKYLCGELSGKRRKGPRGAEELNCMMKGHQLIMGELVDFITGETLKDTHDERYRQKIGRILVNRKGYLKTEIEPRKPLTVHADEKKALLKIDFIITLAGKICMLVKYGPGSLVTRRRAALAASRLIAPYQVPVAVVTNGEDAEIMIGASAKIIAQGMDSIPAKSDLEQIAANEAFITISDRQAELESRILYCYEVDDRCECDDDICKL